MELLVKKISVIAVILAAAAILAFSCGEKMKLPTETPPTGNLGDTLYLALNPPWDAAHGYNFSRPGCLYFGRDTYLYVADTGNDRIVQLDAAGTVHGEFAVPHPISVSQDELMRLLVATGEKKIYRIDLGPAGDRTPRVAFDYAVAPPGVSPSDTSRYFFKLRGLVDPTDRFVSVTDFPGNDKSYFVALSSDQINNGRVLRFWGTGDSREYADSVFDAKYADAVADTFKNPVVITGNGITTTTRPNSIYAYELGGVTHLVVCQDSGSYPVHDMKFERQVWDQHWVFNYTHNPSDADLLDRGFFSRPAGATVDPQGNLYVVEASTRALCGGYKFSRNGELLETLCDADSGNYAFDGPAGITYDIYGDRRTVFVADTGNDRILRFKLSIDMEQ